MSHRKGLEDRVIALGIQTCLSKTGVGYGDCLVHLPMYHQDRNRSWRFKVSQIFRRIRDIAAHGNDGEDLVRAMKPRYDGHDPALRKSSTDHRPFRAEPLYQFQEMVAAWCDIALILLVIPAKPLPLEERPAFRTYDPDGR